MTNDVEHLFMCLLAIIIISLVKRVFKTFFKIELFFFLLLNCKSSYNIFEYKSFISYMICKYIYQSVTCLFIFLMVSFEVQEFLILLKSVLSFFF